MMTIEGWIAEGNPNPISTVCAGINIFGGYG